jgi:hypothetical protein
MRQKATERGQVARIGGFGPGGKPAERANFHARNLPPVGYKSVSNATARLGLRRFIFSSWTTV